MKTKEIKLSIFLSLSPSVAQLIEKQYFSSINRFPHAKALLKASSTLYGLVRPTQMHCYYSNYNICKQLLLRKASIKNQHHRIIIIFDLAVLKVKLSNF